jgi:ribonuclease G
MILIDYINMKKDSHVRELISHIRDIIRNDDVACRYVDMTGLGLIELTRKRVLMSLSEQWKA